MDHARAAQLAPPRRFTNSAARAGTIKAAVIHLGAWLSKRKIGRAKAGFRVGTEEAMHKFGERAFQVGHRDSAVDTETLNLKEHWIVRRIRCVATKDTARSNHSHGCAASLHRVNL